MAEISVVMSLEEAKAVTGLLNVARAQSQVEGGFSNIGRAGQRAFGAQALNQLQSFVTGFISLSAVIGTAKRALDDMQARREEAAMGQRMSRMSAGQLQQISGDDPKRFKELLEKSKKLYLSGGAASMEEAYYGVFEAASAGQESQLDLVAKLRRGGYIKNVGQAMGAAQSIQTTMGAEAGDLGTLLARASKAAAPAKSTIEEVLYAASMGATFAESTGIKSDEMLAATGILTKATKDPMDAGTQIRSLMKDLGQLAAKPEYSGLLKGKGLMGQIEALKPLITDDDVFQQMFGRVEAQAGFRTLFKNAKEVKALTADVSGATTGEMVRAAELYKQIPTLRAAADRESAKAREVVSASEMGVRENERQTAEEDWIAKARKRGDSELSIWLETRGQRFENWLNGGNVPFREPVSVFANPLSRDYGDRMKRWEQQQEASQGGGTPATEETLQRLANAAESGNRQQRVSTSGATNTHTE